MSKIENKIKFYSGWFMLTIFAIVLAIFFSPVFDGKNGLDYLDNLYNSISKGSAYYIDKVKPDADKFTGKAVAIVLEFNDKGHADQTATLFKKAGAQTTVKENTLEVSGDLGKILSSTLEDADRMYYNDGKAISEKYGYDERRVLYNWWQALKKMDVGLKKQKLFKEAEVVTLIMKKAVETSYNYYEIEPQKISDKIWIVIISLFFYVIYTVWYGFAYMYIFEGWGLSLDH